MDDFLVRKGKAAFQQLLDEAKPWVKQREIHRLNEHVCLVRNPCCVVEYRNDKWNAMRVDTFYDVYANETMKVSRPTKEMPAREVEVSAAREWLKSKSRNEAEGMTYAPGQPARTGRNELNRWRPSGLKPKQGSIKRWEKLADSLFAELSPSERNWVDQWIAYPIQHQGTKLATSILLWGTQGTGKTAFFETIGMLYGEHNFTHIDQEQSANAFTASSYEDKQFGLIDEFMSKADKPQDGYNKAKNMITRREVEINAKFKPQYKTPDAINWAFTSNKPDCFYIEDDDRRFMIVQVIGKPLEKTFFDEFHQWRDNGGYAALLHHYSQVDCAGFNPYDHAPRTAARLDMIDRWQTPAENWAFGLREQQAQGVEPSLLCHKDNPTEKMYELYTITDLTSIAASHTPEEKDKKRVDAKSVGEALLRAGYHKVTCNPNGRMTLTYNNGLQKIEVFERVWVVGGDVTALVAETDAAVIRKRYIEERGFTVSEKAKVTPINKAKVAAAGGAK